VVVSGWIRPDVQGHPQHEGRHSAPLTLTVVRCIGPTAAYGPSLAMSALLQRAQRKPATPSVVIRLLTASLSGFRVTPRSDFTGL
jgi:hypothetical protein